MAEENQKLWVSVLARGGYAAKGIVYFTIGVMSLLAAIGRGGDVIGSSDALREIGSKPFGTLALLVIGMGLLAYSAYRLMCAIVDAGGEGTDGSGLAKRTGYFGSAVAYASLGITALTGLSGSSEGEKEMTSGVLGMPGGALVVGAVALAIIAAGIFQWVKALHGSYQSNFTLDSFAARKRHWIERSAKFGLIARGIVFPVIGGFLLLAAIQSDASEAMGIGQALEKLQNQAFGAIILGVTAAGLVCYAIYCWVLAIYGNLGRNV
ncbi:MAG: DUF1206 domain-containing protein [Luteolibacter sp.]